MAALFAPFTRAQDKPAEKVPANTLKIQVTFVETAGEKKVANLPYTFFVQAADSMIHAPWTKVRMGSRVPIPVSKEGATQYFDVGTNIDARSAVAEGGKYDIALNLEHSWVGDDAGSAGGAGEGRSSIIRQFKTEFTLTMKDGQTTQVTEGADPLSGLT